MIGSLGHTTTANRLSFPICHHDIGKKASACPGFKKHSRNTLYSVWFWKLSSRFVYNYFSCKVSLMMVIKELGWYRVWTMHSVLSLGSSRRRLALWSNLSWMLSITAAGGILNLCLGWFGKDESILTFVSVPLVPNMAGKIAVRLHPALVWDPGCMTVRENWVYDLLDGAEAPVPGSGSWFNRVRAIMRGCEGSLFWFSQSKLAVRRRKVGREGKQFVAWKVDAKSITKTITKTITKGPARLGRENLKWNNIRTKVEFLVTSAGWCCESRPKTVEVYG